MKTWNVAGKMIGAMVGAFLVLPIGAAFLVWFADGTDRGRFDTAHVFTTRYIVAALIQIALMIPFFIVADRRKPGTPMTWGEAMVAGTYVFGILFWLYGVLPHEFLNWADSELAWRPDQVLIGPGGQWSEWWSWWERFPMTIHKETLRDLILVLIYVVGLGGFIWAAAFWNDREKKAAEAGAIEEKSQYGRPLIAKAKN